jgi:hypothetical protein
VDAGDMYKRAGVNEWRSFSTLAWSFGEGAAALKFEGRKV